MIIRKLLFKYFPKIGIWILYFITYGKFLHLRNPENFYEKLIWLNFNDRNPLKTKCADKLLVRDYLKEKGLDGFLNELIDTADNPRRLDFYSYPESFVLKCNHGSGMNILCHDKSSFDHEDAVSKLNEWMKTEWAYQYGELHYKGIEPRILCEKNLGRNLIDYKVHCFHGKPKNVMLCFDDVLGKTHWYLYDFDWKHIPFLKQHTPDPNIEKPDNLDEIHSFCSALSEDFIFVRVDFYIIDGKIVFGELTFTPAAFMDDTSDEFNLLCGNLIDIKKSPVFHDRTPEL